MPRNLRRKSPLPQILCKDPSALRLFTICSSRSGCLVKRASAHLLAESIQTLHDVHVHRRTAPTLRSQPRRYLARTAPHSLDKQLNNAFVGRAVVHLEVMAANPRVLGVGALVLSAVREELQIIDQVTKSALLW